MTGATRGIGKEVSRQLAELGATVYVTGRRVEVAEATAKDLAEAGDVRAHAVALDVADSVSIAEFAAAMRESPGALDILVNNAAAFVDWSETTTGADLDETRRVLETNLFGAWRLRCCRSSTRATTDAS